MVEKKRVDPKKIFFKYKCLDCTSITEQPVSESHEIGAPFCSNCGSPYTEYVSTYMLVKKDQLPPKKKRTKNTILNSTQKASKKRVII